MHYQNSKQEQTAAAEPNSTEDERIQMTEAALMKIITQYCGHEAGVRNLRKCIDRIFRKIVAKMEDKKLTVTPAVPIAAQDPLEAAVEDPTTAPTLYKAELPEKLVKDYQVNTRNLELFLDVPPTDDHYYKGINQKLPIGSSNGLAYIDDGQGTVLKI